MSDPERREVPAIEPRLDGMRGWLGDLDRLLSIRTRIGLGLAALALGVGGAGVYLALEAGSESASDREVRELRDALEKARREASAANHDLAAVRRRVKRDESNLSNARSKLSGLGSRISDLETRVRTLRQQVSTAVTTAAAAPAPPPPGTPQTGTGTIPGGAETGPNPPPGTP
jgi:hypothetical protein